MEIRVEAADGCELPTDCFVGVRVGETFKHGKYEPHRCYTFPTSGALDKSSKARIDLYQHIGVCYCYVPADLDSGGTTEQEVIVSFNDATAPTCRLKVHVKATKAASEKQGKSVKSAERQGQDVVRSRAREYLIKYSVEETLSLAVKALLQDQPVDPIVFLCQYLRGGNQKEPYVEKSSPRTKPSALVSSGSARPKPVVSPKKTAHPAKASTSSATPRAAVPAAVPAAVVAPVVVGAPHVKAEDELAMRQKLMLNLLRASADGTLERVVNGAKSAKNEVSIRTSEDAGISSTICDVPLEPQAIQGGKRLEELRLNARVAMTEAVMSGRLETLLIGITAGQIGTHGDATSVQPALVGGTSGGDRNVTEKSSEERMREKVAQGLIAGMSNGRLEEALGQVRGKFDAKVIENPSGDARSKAQRALRAGMADGSLRRAISEYEAQVVAVSSSNG